MSWYLIFRRALEKPFGYSAIILFLPLIMLAVGFLDLSVFRALEYDEAVYLAQVVPNKPAIGFYDTRTHGIVALVAPVAMFDAPTWVVRAYLLAISSVLACMVCANAYKLWGLASIFGLSFFFLLWPGLFYSSEVSPNFFASLFFCFLLLD